MRGALAGAFGPIVTPPGTLTAREKVVLRCASYGMTNDETAEAVGRSTATVKAHRTHVIEKLGATNITHAVALAYEDGILGGK